MLIKRLFQISLLFFYSLGFSYSPEVVKTITHLDGLPGNEISSIYKDHEGILWIGTLNGLAKYDGYQVTNYTNLPYDSNSISANHVNSIVEVDDDRLLIGTYGGGLNLFDRNTQQFTRPANYQSIGLEIKHIEKRQDQFWVSSENKGVFAYDIKTGKIELYSTKNVLEENNAQFTFIDQSNDIWIACWNSLTLIKKGKAISYSSIPFIKKMIQLDPDFFLVGTSKGLYLLNKHTNKTTLIMQKWNVYDLKTIGPDKYCLLYTSPSPRDA